MEELLKLLAVTPHLGAVIVLVMFGIRHMKEQAEQYRLSMERISREHDESVKQSASTFATAIQDNASALRSLAGAVENSMRDKADAARELHDTVKELTSEIKRRSQ